MDFLNSILQGENDDEFVIDENRLELIWNYSTNSNNSVKALIAKRSFIEIFKKNLPELKSDPAFYYKTQAWKVVIKKHFIKGGIAAALTSALMVYLGLNEGIASAVIPSIVPMLFDIENIVLSRKEEEILINIPVKRNIRKYEKSEYIYASLPRKIKKQITEMDFKDFLEKLVLSGIADKSRDGHYILLEKDKFKIIFE